MTQLSNKPDLDQPLQRRQGTDSPWLWVFIIGGSIAIHTALIGMVLPLVNRSGITQPVSSVPIDLIEFSDTDTQTSTTATNNPQTTRTQTTQPQTIRTQATAAQSDATPPSKTTLPAQTDSVAAKPIELETQAGDRAPLDSISIPEVTEPASVPVPSPEPVAPPSNRSVAPSSSPESEQQSLEQPSLDELSEASNSSPEDVFPGDVFPGVPPEPELPPTPTAPAPRPIASPTPTPTASPLISSMPIDVPLPDVSETMPVPPDEVEPSHLSQVDLNQEPLPAHLTASLTADVLPPEATSTALEESAPEDVETSPSAIVRPVTEIKTFPADPTQSPCLVTPEAVQVLGATVAMQVSTNAAGEVVETVLQESSRNRAYDDLATCFVQHWEFEPAIAQGKPVAANAMIRITIDRG